ncbi:DUF1648 domain-containing protein [Paenibacillus sp. N4]|uniref:DUF1648 domain-containing protein n=1 Tax=Paenibacillus vietnamensis TaxID=2590547 RepID=UPI001CD0E744|nr:DUF1648 domain-containing protein [Paenibacillus vietnamensis]MCA0756828.1 DUF1648 domain-containing protein [Paenibacillus vietnamensis]
MEKRPILAVPRTALERWHDAAAIVILLLSIVYFGWKWPGLPATVAIHFNAKGDPDGWGSKATLLLLPALTLFLYAGLTSLRQIPHHFNYLKPITEQNALYQYRTAIHMLSWLKLEIVLLFSYMQWAFIRNAEGLASGIGIWLVPAALAAVFGTLIIYIVKLTR